MYTTADGEIRRAFIRTPLNYDMNEASDASALRCLDESRTQQQFKDECDINTIVDNFTRGLAVPMTAMQPMTGDFVNVEGDFHQALMALEAAKANFMSLPAKVRERFGNKPENFVDFCVDPANIEAVRDLGLAPRPAAPTMTEIKEEK